MTRLRLKNFLWLFTFILITGCTHDVVKTEPEAFDDKSPVTIIANANGGNKGLLNFNGPVYVHLGLITDSSINPNHWRYVKFSWGSEDELARAKPAGNNKWSYTIPNIRSFFGVPEKEQILQLAVLFRQGGCIDTFCLALRNVDRTDIFLPVKVKSEK